MAGAMPPSHSGPREWDADVYHRISEIQLKWGLEVLDRLPLEGTETVLDAGCGSGRVTAALLERLPRGRVIGVDGSAEMVRKAREVLGPEVEVRHEDLSELSQPTPVDAIFSNAVFHWIKDHRGLFARLRRALVPGGRLVVQCGGRGNVASLATVITEVAAAPEYAEHLEGSPRPWNFADDVTTASLLEGAGFVDVHCWLEPREVRPDHPREFLRVVSLGPHLAALPEELRDPFVDDVASGMGDPFVLDYVRLNIDARAPG
jgi:trans-aconitate 2-methyltransferase